MRKGKTTVAATIEILEALAGSGGLGPRAIAARVDVPKSTAHRLLEEMATLGVLAVDDQGSYRIGPRFHGLASASVGNADLVQIAQPALQALQEDTGETIILAIASRDVAVIVARVRSSHAIQYVIDPGTIVPLHSGAVGKAILAWLPARVRDAYLRGPLKRYTDRTIVEPARLRAELETARRRGYVLSRGERVVGAFGIAAPVMDGHGVVGALGITAPEGRIARPSVGLLGRRVSAVAARVSLALGAPASADGHLPHRAAGMVDR